VSECKPLIRGSHAGTSAAGAYSPLSGAAALFGLALLILFAGQLVETTGGAALGRAVQGHPFKPTLKAPETKRLKLRYGEPFSKYTFKFKLRRYSWVWWCWPPPPPSAG